MKRGNAKNDVIPGFYNLILSENTVHDTCTSMNLTTLYSTVSFSHAHCIS